jgi:hypothetical protein
MGSATNKHLISVAGWGLAIHLHRHGITTEVQIMERPAGSCLIPMASLVNGGIVAQNVPHTLPPSTAAKKSTP